MNLILPRELEKSRSSQAPQYVPKYSIGCRRNKSYQFFLLSKKNTFMANL